MPVFFRYPFQFPPRGALLCVLAALYILPGLIGHDPWKTDDTIQFGVVLELLSNHDWLVPHLLGEAYFNNPPLYYWIAAFFTKIFGAILPMHDAARLVSGLFVALYASFMAATARQLHGPPAGSAAALLSLGCLGLLLHGHDIQPLNALLAATAASYYGILRLLDKPVLGGSIAGLAMGLGFLAVGILVPLSLLPLCLLLPLFSKTWRTRHAAIGFTIATAIVIGIAAIWIALLIARRPELAIQWWSNELAEFSLADDWLKRLGKHTAMLTWFAWPAFPLCLWTCWRKRKQLREPSVALGLTAFVVVSLILGLFITSRSQNALPFLPPLVLLAIPATATLRRGAANAFDWFGRMAFTFFAAVIWIGWSALIFGWPAQMARNFAKLVPGYPQHISWFALSFAVFITLGWCWLIFTSPRSTYRGTVNWLAGMALIWGLTMSLWLPTLDYGKTYRLVVEEITDNLPPHPGCIATRGVGDVQRVSLQYFGDIVTVPQTGQSATSCRYLLVQSTDREQTPPVEPHWKIQWEGRRRGDRHERFRLYAQE